MRLLILSASAGIGHHRAAEALKRWADLSQQFYARWYDALDYTPRIFKRFYDSSYRIIAGKLPTLWSLLYEHASKGIKGEVFSRIITSYNRSSYRRLIRFVRSFRADFILCTHFLPSNVILSRKEDIPPVGVVITDYQAHSFWINKDASCYFVASEELRTQLLTCGIPQERIHLTGIPIHPEFSMEGDKQRFLRAIGLEEGILTILIISSGFGGGRLEEALGLLLSLRKDFQIIAVAGASRRLKERLLAVAKGSPRVKVFGYVSNIHELMDGADLVVTKAGGLTISESLAKGLPLVVFSPIPGQEERNCRYLVERGVAVEAKDPQMLRSKIEELLSKREKLKLMKNSAKRLAKPLAGREILRVFTQVPLGKV